MVASATDALEIVRAEIGDPHAWRERERVVETELRYADETPVRVHIRKRGRRYDVDDEGAGVRKARAVGVSDWDAVATDVAEAHDLNVNRSGVVFVPAVEGGPDLAWLVFRVARCSYSVHSELLETLELRSFNVAAWRPLPSSR
jgi:hypothetical protein